MAAIEIKDVVKRFGGTVAVDHVSIDVADGEFLVLVGPSGCGKTTTLRMVAGLERITSGDITVGGRRVTDLSPKDRNLAMVFQSYALYSHLTVRENLGFALKARGTPKAQIAERIDKVATMLELGDLLDRTPKTLSGGQRQRVALGRAIIREPQAFLMDEPLSNLDAMLRLRTRKDIIELTRSLGSTVIYVTHDQTEAMTMGHRIAVMKDGRVQQLDSPANVYARPNNVFVAQFVGQHPMNMIGTNVVRDGGTELRGGGFRVPIEQDVGGNEQVTLGIRPEDVELASGGTPAEVSVVERLGAELLVSAKTEGSEISLVTSAKAGLAHGDRIEVKLPADRLHLFADPSGERI
jgi:multiple sugar transport system ATP-binding protein